MSGRQPATRESEIGDQELEIENPGFARLIDLSISGFPFLEPDG
jgi:hypothetical protein